MAQGSPSAIQAITDRPYTERSETKGSDSSEGQFASLMAQFARTPKATKAPEHPFSRSARSDKGSQAQSTKTQTNAGPEVPAAAVGSSPRADGPSGSNADVQDPKADGTSPGTDAKNAKAEPATPGISPTGNQAPDDGSTAVAGPLSSLLPMGGIPTKATADGTSAALLAAAPGAPAQASTSEDTTTQTAGAMPGALMGAPSPAIPTQPESMLPAGMGRAAKSASAADSSGLTAETETSATLQPDPQTTSLIDPNQLKTQASTQAAIAELASRMKNGPRPESGVAPANTTATDATLVVKSMKVADAQALSLERGEAQADPIVDSVAADAGSPNPVGDGKSSTLPSANPESALPMLDALTPKSALTQTSNLHAPDGSALATTGLLLRAGETPTVSAPAAPLAPAAQPQAPVIQVEGGLRWMLKGGAQEAELQLHPDSLGQVTIHLRVEGGEVHARLWITEPTSMQAVQEGRPHLEMALKEQGLQLGSFDLQQGHRPFQEASTTSSYQEPSFQESAPTRQEAPASPSTSILNSHHVELYA